MSENNEQVRSAPAWAGVLVAWTVFELLSGLKTWWRFSTTAVDQHIYLMHAVFGALVLVPAVAVMARALSRGAGRERAVAAGVLGMAVAGAALTGLVMSVNGSTTAPSQIRTAHAAASVAAGLLLLVLAATARMQPSLAPARSGSAWRSGLLAFVFPWAAAGASMAIWPLESMAIPWPEKYYRKDFPFLASRTGTEHGTPVKVESIASSKRCKQCHEEIYNQWYSSSHHHSTISEWYQQQLKLRMDTADIRGNSAARFCGGCHEPVAMFTGNLDDRGKGPSWDLNREEGITCVACHRITKIKDTVGNGSYILGAHQPYLFQNSDNPLLAAIGRGLLRGKPDVHEDDLMRPPLKTADVCATCHHVFFKTLYGKLFRIQSDYDQWKASPYNKGPGHEKTQRCQDCHMPLVESRDPAAKNGKVRSHRFIAANTARPFQTGDKEQLARTEEFLQQACYLSVKAPKQAAAGEKVKFDVIVTNANVGHNFPGGTTDMVDAWIEAIATDETGKQLFASGLVDPKTLHVDPNAVFYRTYPINIYGDHLYRRDLWNTYRLKEARMIEPGKSDVASYEVAIPADAKGKVSFKARLRFRRSHQKFTEFAFPGKRMELPITDLADDDAKVSLGPVSPAADPHLTPDPEAGAKPAGSD